jgi:hypothetical protein
MLRQHNVSIFHIPPPYSIDSIVLHVYDGIDGDFATDPDLLFCYFYNRK